jgi:hypothetical protein
MNCQTLQHRLLELERPDRPPPELQDHLGECPACRAWQRQLFWMEQQVPFLPVPPTTAKANVLRQVLTGMVEPGSPPLARLRRLPGELPGQRRARGVRKLAVAVSLAAGLVLVTLALWGLQGSKKGPPPKRPESDELVKKLLQHDMGLARAATPGERLERLADLADALQESTRALAPVGDAKDLDQLAVLYGRVVEEGLITQAQALDEKERAAVVAKIVSRLDRAATADEQLPGGPSATPPLQLIAQKARAVKERLQNLSVKG